MGEIDGLGIFWCAVFLLNGPWLLFWPEKAWRGAHFLSFRNPDAVEPSDLVIGWYRFCGLLSLAFGVFILGVLLGWWSLRAVFG